MAMDVAMRHERSRVWNPVDVSHYGEHYDIRSELPDGEKCFIEVKGRLQDAKTVTVTKNEILTALNKPDDFILAIVLVPPAEESPSVDPWQIGEPAERYGITQDGCQVYYVREPFSREPDFGVTSVNYDLKDLLAHAEVPG
jgi:hypothetical protein